MSEKIVRVGIWGIGRAGYGMIRSELLQFPEKFKIVAGYDIIPDRAAKLADEVGAKAHADAESFLADPNIDMVVVATRSFNHVEHAIQALRAGKDVLVEKPMATSVEDVDRLYGVAAETGRKIVARHNRRFDKHFVLAKEIVAKGLIGEVYLVQIRTGGYNRRDDWQTMRQFGGGQLFNWGPHCIDWALQFIGGRAVEIQPSLKRLVCAGEAEDFVKINMRGPGGALADIEINGAGVFPQPLMLVQGTRGAISLSWDKYTLKYLAEELPPILPKPGTPGEGSFGNTEKLQWTEVEAEIVPEDKATFWGAVYDRVALNKPFPITPEQAREVIRVIDTASRICTL